MKKLFVCFLVCVSVSLNASASVVGHGAFADLIEELQYSLTVEWDQEDQTKRSEILKRFSLELLELKKQGLSQSQVLSDLRQISSRPELIDRLERDINLHEKGLITETEFNSRFTTDLNQAFKSGASWNGDTGTVLIITAFSIVMVGLATWFVTDTIEGFKTGKECAGKSVAERVCTAHGCQMQVINEKCI